jgi:glucose-1-phosphate thymidylyltransferase
MKSLILAAGYATRLYPLTLDTPKALLPIGGKPMLDYLVSEIATLEDMTEVHIVSNHRFIARFEAWAGGAASRYPGLRFTVWDDGTTSNDDRLGAVGDIQFVIDRAALDDDLLIAASDNFFTFPLRDFAADFRRTERDTLLTAHLDDLDTLRKFGVATLGADNRVLSLVEKPENPPSDVGVYALYLYRRDTLPLIRQYLDEGNSPDAPGHFPEWLCTRRDVRAYIFTGECIDIGSPEAYREVNERFGGGNRGQVG